MSDFKIVKVGAVDAQGNSKEATPNEIFGFLAYNVMAQALDTLIEKESVNINGIIVQRDDKVLEKLEGIKNHIAGRWNNPIDVEKVIRKTAELKIEL